MWFFKQHNDWAEGYGWTSDKLHRGEPIALFVDKLDKSENYKLGARAAIKAELAIERTRQATLELHRVEVAELKRLVDEHTELVGSLREERDKAVQERILKEKSRAEWNKVATTRLEILEGIRDQLGEKLL